MLFLHFQIGDDAFALAADRIVEILPLVELKKERHAPEGVAGSFDHRGRFVPVIDLCPLEPGRAVRRRLRSCKLEDADHYWERLLRSPDEVQHLVEAVVVPETWFFRDPQAFAAMVRVIMEEWLPAHPTGVLRLLSLPCSTGEE